MRERRFFPAKCGVSRLKLAADSLLLLRYAIDQLPVIDISHCPANTLSIALVHRLFIDRSMAYRPTASGKVITTLYCAAAR